MTVTVTTDDGSGVHSGVQRGDPKSANIFSAPFLSFLVRGFSGVSPLDSTGVSFPRSAFAFGLVVRAGVDESPLRD